MRPLTRLELVSKSTGELYALHREAFDLLARSAPETADRRNALASLENIEGGIRGMARALQRPA